MPEAESKEKVNDPGGEVPSAGTSALDALFSVHIFQILGFA